MIKPILLVIATFGGLTAFAQSTDDIRFTYGEGPYPLYVNGSIGMTGTKYLFRDFIRDYTAEKGGDSSINTLYSLEINVGIAINCMHCLAIKKLHITNWAVEIGYMTAARRLYINSGHDLQLVESIGTFRFIYRYTELYPISFQLHAGLNTYSFYQIREVIETDSVSSLERLRVGSSFFENNNGKLSLLFPGYNFRFRLALFDPTGVASGFGLFLEYSYHGNWTKENFAKAYEVFELQALVGEDHRRNFGRFSLGLVIPLAIKIF